MTTQDPQNGAASARFRLADFPLFSTLPFETAEELARGMRAIDLRCGEALVREGEPGNSLFLVVDGRFEARVAAPGGGERLLRAIGRGEPIGEMAVLTAEPRSCTVVATRRSSVLELPGEDFLRVLQQHPRELLALTRHIILRAARPAEPGGARRIALLPLDPRLDLSWLVQTLGESLARFGSTLRLDRALAMRKLGDAHDSATVPRLSSRFLEWLAQNERSHDFVVYEALHRMGEWTHRCLAQADLVLLVGDAGRAPDLTALEREMLGAESGITLAPRALVLLRPTRDVRPAGTAAWLEPRSVSLHHHVAHGERGDVERLARIVAGRSVSLVLSGGGVRGFAHIGVLRAMEEGGLPIDFIGGASIGALIGGLRAMEWSAARMHEVCKRVVSGKRSITDPTFPFLSIFSARRGARAVREMCEGWSIEDLPINYFAVSADLCRAEEFVHRRGPLWLAMRASGSLPGVFPPVIAGDLCLVDGGVLNNLPVDVMARLAGGRIAAVDVSRETVLDLPEAPDIFGEDTSVSGFRLLLRRLNPFRRRAPRILHIGDVLGRAGEVAAVHIGRGIQARTQVARRIEPPVDGYRMLDFASIDPIIEAGYRYASAELGAWKEELLAG